MSYSYTKPSNVDLTRNPWLRRMVVSGTAIVLIGLATTLIGRNKVCFYDGRVCVYVSSDGFTEAQIIGLGLMAVGFLTLVGWMVANAICWQVTLHANAGQVTRSDPPPDGDQP